MARKPAKGHYGEIHPGVMAATSARKVAKQQGVSVKQARADIALNTKQTRPGKLVAHPRGPSGRAPGA